jgi:hypothetical protein
MHHALCVYTTLNEQTSAARKLAEEGWVTVYEGVDNSVRITGLQSGAVYRFRVAAVNARGGSSLWSELAQVHGRTTVVLNDLTVQVLALLQSTAILMTCVAVVLSGEQQSRIVCLNVLVLTPVTATTATANVAATIYGITITAVTVWHSSSRRGFSYGMETFSCCRAVSDGNCCQLYLLRTASN